MFDINVIFLYFVDSDDFVIINFVKNIFLEKFLEIN